MSSSGRIAILDDDDAVRRALGRFLSAHKFSVRTYGTAARLFLDVKSCMPDCFILDFLMTDMNGLEVHQRLRDQGINMPTIIITAHNEPELHEKCNRHGITAFLTKPLQGRILIETINLAMKKD